MRLLADENFPGTAVDALRSEGHDVLWIRTDAPGTLDHDILQQAQVQARILLTFDKDFGELAFHRGLYAAAGIILFRIAPRSAQYIASVAVAVIGSRTDWAGHFSVVEGDRIRMTRLPAR